MNNEKIKLYFKAILQEMGENPNREGLKETPDRVARMYKELFKGYKLEQKPKITAFNNGQDGVTYDQMIIDEGDFYSHCEHHMIPFFGRYWFAYIPNPKGKIIGLSKVARIVDYYAAKLQIQERLGQEIINEIWNALANEDNEPLGMALVMRAKHLCKSMRGCKKEGWMTTNVFKGVFKDDTNNARQEFLNFVNNGGK